MQESTIFWLLIIIVSADFVFDKTLGLLNRKASKQPIPPKLFGIYDTEQYEKSQAYQRANGVISTWSSLASFIFMIIALYFGWFGWLDQWIRTFSPLAPVTTLIFFGILFLVSSITSLPLDWYSTFVIEEKFGFNKSTKRTFWLDKLKGLMLTIVIGGILLSAMIYLVMAMGSQFWVYFWAVLIAFMLIANLIYTTAILPLFNKLTPLEDGELRAAIEAYSKKVNFPLQNIFVMDGSKRSSKGNAFFSGFGKNKKVVLFDTLIEKHTTEELVAIFAHEVGHYKNHHIWQGLTTGILTTGLMLFVLSKMVFNAEVSYAMGGEISALHLNLLAFAMLYSPVSRILGILSNILSRKNEYEADAYAKNTYGEAPLISGLKRLSAESLSNLTPHPAYVFVHYSHPSLLQRIEAMEKD